MQIKAARTLTLIFVFFNMLLPLRAQEKLLTLDDIYLRYWTMFWPAGLQQLQWQPATENYTLTDGNKLLRYHAGLETANTLLNLDELSTVLQKQLSAFPLLTWIDANRFCFMKRDSFIIFDITKKNISYQLILPEKAGNTDFCLHNQYIAFTLDSNLYISTPEGNIRISSDGGRGIVYGTTVHREEFGISKGTFWSPKGNYLAFYRMDETMVTDYPLVDVTTRVAKLSNIKYPMAGMASHQVKLGIYDTKLRKTVYVETGEPKDQYLTNVAWSPDERFIYIAVLNREQNHMWLNQYDATTGKLVKTLFEETDAKYVEPLYPMYFIVNSRQFIWQSRRSGFNHLYLYDSNGKLIKQITSGNWEVLDLITVTPDGDVFFKANIDNPTEVHLCSVNLMSGKLTQITQSTGLHNCLVSSNAKYILDTYSSLNIPLNTDLLNQKGKLIRNLHSARNTLKDYNLGEVTISTILANDGKTPLYYKLIKPVSFNPKVRYPVIVYVYGGPHLQLVTNSWNNKEDLWFQYMAERGYLCFILDNRGSENRGRDFENIIHRQVGVTEMQDQISGINYLKSLSFIDSLRIAVYGWSFGGFLTTSLMLNYPNVFKVGVAGGPVMDWRYYEVMYGERYMDTPQENPEGYEKTSCLNKTSQLQGKLLIIHGDMDHTVVWQNSLLFLENCIKNNRQVDYFVYPTHEHNVIGKDRLHLKQKVTEYLIEHL